MGRAWCQRHWGQGAGTVPREAWGHRAAMGTAGDTSSPTPPTPPPQTLAPPVPGAAANRGTKVPLWGPAVGTAGWWHRARAPSDTGDSPVSPYHDGIAGAGGQEDVLGVGGDAVALLQEPRHVLPHQLDAGAGAVGTWGHRGDIRGSREGTSGVVRVPRGAHRRSGRRRLPAAAWRGPWRPTGWICRS